VRTYDRSAKAIKTFTNNECGFEYRTSTFKKNPGRYIVLEVQFQLRQGEYSDPITYGELARDSWSAGSFFTNPIISAEVAATLPADAPRWPLEDGRVKTSAAWLIENAGVAKGSAHGGARVSTKHVLALTNAGDATASDLVELAKSAQAKVYEKFAITLEPEVNLVGLSLQ
jgi:UDP-N-acetylmuramate dehydrogenase